MVGIVGRVGIVLIVARVGIAGISFLIKGRAIDNLDRLKNIQLNEQKKISCFRKIWINSKIYVQDRISPYL